MTYFFTYGDRMGSERMAQFAPDATLVGPARLPGYRLAFNVASRAWGGGAANAVPDPQGSMWGVLWDFGDDDPAALDSFHGDDEITHGVVEVTVDGPDGSISARTLVVGTDGGFVRPTSATSRCCAPTPSARGCPRRRCSRSTRRRPAHRGGSLLFSIDPETEVTMRLGKTLLSVLPIAVVSSTAIPAASAASKVVDSYCSPSGQLLAP